MNLNMEPKTKNKKKERTKSTSNLTLNFEGSGQASKTKLLRTDSAKLCYLHTRSSILKKQENVSKMFAYSHCKIAINFENAVIYTQTIKF